MRNKTILLLFTIATILLIIQACKKEDLPDKDSIDEEVFNFTKETSGYVWYKNSDQLLQKGNSTGHQEAFLRTKFNAIAATMLNDTFKVKENAIFPDGSVIIKELHSSMSQLSTYAIMYKNSSSVYADATGWVWGYYRPGGEVRQSAENKGIECRSCHLQNGNIDLTLMNKDHP